MTRRLRIAGTAFGALLVPACSGFQPDATVTHPAVSAQPPAVKPPNAPLLGQSQAAKPRVVEKFAEGRSEDSAFSMDRPKPPAQPMPTGVPIASPSALEQTKVEARVEAPSLPDPPRVVPTVPDRGVIKPAPEPVPDAEGVIRPNWPTIKGMPSELPAKDEPKLTLPTPGELPPSATKPVVPPPDPGPVVAPDNPPAIIAPPPVSPPALPPGVIGSSIHKANASPASEISIAEAIAPVAPPTAEKSVPAAADSPILRAVRAFQDNKPDEAVECLKAYDPATQQILLSLLPALGRLGDGKLQQMKPEEMDILLEQLTKVPNMLRPRASLQSNNVRLCREVHNFAHVEPFPERHVFRPDDIVYLYMELANFSCVPDQAGGYTVTMASSLELKDGAGNVVWRVQPKDVPDKVSSPPQDYYRNFRLSIPNVSAGTYMLAIKTTDRPTGRSVEKSVELRIGVR
jgi:hypothetical protein